MTTSARSQINPNAAFVLSALKKTYPKAKIILRYRTAWELMVAVILSAQCTDVTVNRVTEKLFTKYKTLKDYIRADPTVFENDIRSTGFYRNKARHILAAANLIRTKFRGRVPDSMDNLLTVPGVARKTANVVLGNAYGVVEGIAVDTHVHRLSQRLRLVDLTKVSGKKLMIFEKEGKVFIDYIKDADPVKIEGELMTHVSKEDWFDLTYRLIDHGRAVCKAKNPHCSDCMLRTFCPSSRV